MSRDAEDKEEIPWLTYGGGQLPSDEDLDQVRETLARGELIIFPTDTVYGVAADERVEGAEARLFVAKQRPADRMIPRLVAGMDQVIAHGAEVSNAAMKLAEKYWPGALTLVLPHPHFGSIGYRVPDHPVARAVLSAVDYPLLVTSANQSGAPETGTAGDAFNALAASVAMVLDGGPATSMVPSSVVGLAGETPEIFREGPISSDDIFEILRG